MARDGSFLVEEFLGAITSQLDRTQDALAIKAVNRPLTYAIKDFDMELKVFVDMDAEGKVRFRSPSPNETGASSLRIGFTTITRPMIEENTVELSLSRSPTLEEAGVPEAERQRLERLGVRNTSELRRLGQSTGTAGVARLADVPVDRLRAALTFGQPQVRSVRPAAPAAQPPVGGTPTGGPPVSTPPSGRPPAGASPPSQQPPAGGSPPIYQPPAGGSPPPRPPAPAYQPPAYQPPVAKPPAYQPLPYQPTPGSKPIPVFMPPGTRRIELSGHRLLADDGTPPTLRLGGRQLDLAEADDHRLVADLPDDAPAAGTLEVDHGDGEIDTYELATADPWSPNGA